MSRLSSVTLSRLALTLFFVGSAGWLLRLDYAQKISTNVLDLIPANERSPEISIIRDFARSAQSRVMLFALRDTANPDSPPQAAAIAFAAHLAASPEFTEAIALGATTSQDKMGTEIFTRRIELLLPSWLGAKSREFGQTNQPSATFPEWLADSAVSDMDAFLSRPEASALQDIILRDPLLLVPRLIDHAQLATPPGGDGHALVWALIRESPLAETGQQPVFDVIDAATAKLAQQQPTISVQWSGINRFAAASRARIEAEIKLLHVCSILAVLGVCVFFVRRLLGIVHFIPIIGLSIMGAWTISTLVFDRLHILVFVIGSLLAGVAIDYGVYIYMQPAQRPDEPYGSKLRRLLKPLLASCFTTVAGFSLLLFSDLPLIRQIGLFVASGLLCAVAVAMLYFAQLRNPFLESRPIGHFGLGHHRPGYRIMVRWLACGALGVALFGPWRLHWHDDVRELDIPSPELRANETELRSFFGHDADHSTAYLSYGDNVAEARQNLQTFLDVTATSHPGIITSSLGLLLPTAADWQALPERLAHLAPFAAKFRTALESRGFEADAFAEFFADWNDTLARPPAQTYAEVVADVDALLQGPIALLHNSTGPYWFITLVESHDDVASSATPQTVNVDQLQSLNELFTRYRWSALRLSLIGLGCIIVGVFATYPPRHGLRIALIPAGACFVVFGGFGLFGQTLNLFNLLGAFLGFCLSHNYAIFSSENANVGHAPPVSIRLSALSTTAAFGVLGFSQIPVIHALGLTVALIVATALIMVELEPLLRHQKIPT